jgi:hypothetical protein
MIPRFDIFQGTRENQPMWLETAESLGKAYERIATLSAEKPGQYFIFDNSEQIVVDKVDTTVRNGQAKKHATY